MRRGGVGYRVEQQDNRNTKTNGIALSATKKPTVYLDDALRVFYLGAEWQRASFARGAVNGDGRSASFCRSRMIKTVLNGSIRLTHISCALPSPPRRRSTFDASGPPELTLICISPFRNNADTRGGEQPPALPFGRRSFSSDNRPKRLHFTLALETRRQNIGQRGQGEIVLYYLFHRKSCRAAEWSAFFSSSGSGPIRFSNPSHESPNSKKSHSRARIVSNDGVSVAKFIICTIKRTERRHSDGRRNQSGKKVMDRNRFEQKWKINKIILWIALGGARVSANASLLLSIPSRVARVRIRIPVRLSNFHTKELNTKPKIARKIRKRIFAPLIR